MGTWNDQLKSDFNKTNDLLPIIKIISLEQGKPMRLIIITSQMAISVTLLFTF